MDYTAIVIALLTTLVTVLTPVIVTAAAVYGRKAVAAFETSKYAAAYANLDPVLREAIDAARAEAFARVRTEGVAFARDDVLPLIHRRATEAANAIGQAAGVRVDLQPEHFNDLVALAAREVQETLDELDREVEVDNPRPEPVERHIAPAGEAFRAAQPDNLDGTFGPAVAFPAGAVSRRAWLDGEPVSEYPVWHYGEPIPVRDDGTNYDPGVPPDVNDRAVYSKYSEVD